MTSRPICRWRAASATTLLALLALVGCGGGEEEQTSPPAESSTTSSADSSESTEPVEPSEPTESESVTTSADELTADTFVPAITDAMVDAGTARVTATVEAAGQSLRIDGIQQVGESVADNAMELTIRGGGLDGRMVLVDKTLYLDLGQLTGGKYVRIDLDKKGPGAEMFGQLLQSTDTAAAVEALQGAVQDLEVLGEEQVDGVATTRYRLTVDTERALESQDLPPEATQSLPETLGYEMWVDEDRLLRRMVVDIPGALTTLTASEWGEPVDISAPPASEVSKSNPFAAPS